MDFLLRALKNRINSKRFLFISLFLFLVAGQVGAATLYFSPSSGSKAVGSSFVVTLRVNTAGVAINAAEGSIVFDPAELQVISVSKQGSVFTLWASEPEFSNAEGTISFAGGRPSPGYSGSAGLVLTVNFRARTASIADLVLVSGAVLANDGSGTNVLTSLGKASFSLTAPGTVPGSTLTPTPSKIPQPTPTSSVNPSPDTLPPGSFKVERVDSSDPTNPRPEFLWLAHDTGSGINRYEIKIDTQDDLKLDPAMGGKKYALPLQYPGRHILVVKAFDNAENYTVASTSFSVASIDPPIIKTFTDRVKDGERAKFTGIAKPNHKIVLYGINKDREDKLSAKIIKIESDDHEIPYSSEAELQKNSFQVSQAQSDESGNWNIETTSVPSGKYYIYARSIDDRGAISSPSNVVTMDVYKPGISKYLGVLDRAWQIVLDFLVNQWFWILAGLFGIAVVIFLVEKVFPVLGLEWQRLSHLFQEHQLHKDLDVKVKKTAIELDMLSSDVKKELALLDKIEQHRGLHRDEKYLKEKLEKYSKLLKTLR